MNLCGATLLIKIIFELSGYFNGTHKSLIFFFSTFLFYFAQANSSSTQHLPPLPGLKNKHPLHRELIPLYLEFAKKKATPPWLQRKCHC